MCLFNQPWPLFPMCEWPAYDRFHLSKPAPLASVGAGTPSAQRFLWRCCFCDAVAACFDSMAHAAATVLVGAITIAVDDADGGAEGIIFGI